LCCAVVLAMVFLFPDRADYAQRTNLISGSSRHPLLDALRRATAGLHAQLDAVVQSAQPFGSMAAYAAFLSRHLDARSEIVRTYGGQTQARQVTRLLGPTAPVSFLSAGANPRNRLPAALRVIESYQGPADEALNVAQGVFSIYLQTLGIRSRPAASLERGCRTCAGRELI
jgi:hypothetical protein